MHFVLNCFIEAVEINLRVRRSRFPDFSGDSSGLATGHLSVYALLRLVSRQTESGGKTDKESARVSQQFGASEDLWEFETPFVERSQT